MGFIQGVHRNQPVMFPESLDEYIGDDNPWVAELSSTGWLF